MAAQANKLRARLDDGSLTARGRLTTSFLLTLLTAVAIYAVYVASAPASTNDGSRRTAAAGFRAEASRGAPPPFSGRHERGGSGWGKDGTRHGSDRGEAGPEGKRPCFNKPSPQAGGGLQIPSSNTGGNPGDGNPGAGAPGGKPGSGRPGGKPGGGRPGAGRPGAGRPGGKPGAGKPGAGRPGGKPGGGAPGGGSPGGGNSGGEKPGSGQSGGNQSGGNQPGGGQSGGSQSGGESRGNGSSGSGAHDPQSGTTGNGQSQSAPGAVNQDSQPGSGVTKPVAKKQPRSGDSERTGTGHGRNDDSSAPGAGGDSDTDTDNVVGSQPSGANGVAGSNASLSAAALRAADGSSTGTGQSNRGDKSESSKSAREANANDLRSKAAVSRAVDHVPLGFRLLLLGLMFAVAVLSVVSLRERRRAQSVARVAQLDYLTGLANREGFDRMLGQEWRRAVRYGRPLGLVFVDLDHFKAYNDSHGHLAGDRLLREVAAAINSTARGSDFTARLGGDEFVVLCPESSEQGLESLTRRLTSETAPLEVTLSIGYALQGPDDVGPEDIVARADAAMYRAKGAGRAKQSSGNPMLRAMRRSS